MYLMNTVLYDKSIKYKYILNKLNDKNDRKKLEVPSRFNGKQTDYVKILQESNSNGPIVKKLFIEGNFRFVIIYIKQIDTI